MAVAQCVAESFKVQSGLGQPESSLRGQMFDHYQKVSNKACSLSSGENL